MIATDLFPDVAETLALDAAPAVELQPLSLGDVLRAQRRGVAVLDTRSPREFADGHLAGSTHISLGAGFKDSAEALIPPECPVALVAPPGREEEAAAQLCGAGRDRVIGFLAGGIDAVGHLLVPVRHPAQISGALLRQRLARGPLTVIDVRDEAEWRRDGIPRSINIPLRHFRQRMAEIPAGPVVIYCRTGDLSSTAASLLEQTGRMNVVVLASGLAGSR